jgi:hypothetical protein
MPSKGRPRVIVRLEAELVAELKAAAAARAGQGRVVGDDEAGVSGILREAVIAWLERRRGDQTAPPPPRRRSARSARGSARKGKPPSSEEQIALTVLCIMCCARVGQPCQVAGGRPCPPHPDRLADALLAAQPIELVLPTLPECPVCYAVPGAPCTERDGLTRRIHTSRRIEAQRRGV